MFEDDFEANGNVTHEHSLSSRSRLLMAIHFLREHPSYKTFKLIYHISKSTISRNIHFIMPKLYLALNEISWPVTFQPSWEGVVGAIDCSAHYRYRVHPRQADFYRGDKHAFFITAQVICSLQGCIWNVCLGLGHNNDAGMLNIIGDRGYHYLRIIIPDDKKDKTWNDTQKSMRSIVERVFGLNILWRFNAIS